MITSPQLRRKGNEKRVDYVTGTNQRRKQKYVVPVSYKLSEVQGGGMK